MSEVEERFWAKVRKGEPDECWEWTGAKLKGYGLFHVDGKVWRAHRWSYMMSTGGDPDNLHVLHECDNPSCVNPSHLILGTHQDNMADRDVKGRGSRKKIPPEHISEMRRLYATGEYTQCQLAEMFKIRQATVSAKVRGVVPANR